MNGTRPNTRGSTLEKISTALNVTMEELTGKEPFYPEQTSNQTIRPIPLIGTIRAGDPLLMMREEVEQIYLPDRNLPKGNLFILNVVGDSMDGGDRPIKAGDMAMINADAEVCDRDIAAVIVNGDEATIKQIRFLDGFISLFPANTQYKPTIHAEDEVRILGKLVFTMQRR